MKYINIFVCRGSCKDWGTIVPELSACVKTALISRQTLGLFSGLDLTQTFE